MPAELPPGVRAAEPKRDRVNEVFHALVMAILWEAFCPRRQPGVLTVMCAGLVGLLLLLCFGGAL